jgi:hypothetical protein
MNPRKLGQRTYQYLVRQNIFRSHPHLISALRQYRIVWFDSIGMIFFRRSHLFFWHHPCSSDTSLVPWTGSPQRETSSMPRRIPITNREKVAFLDEIDQRQRLGESMRAICWSLGIQPCQARQWKGVREKLIQPNRGGCASVHAGRPSILASIGDQLMTWLFQKRDQGVMVSMRILVVVQASGLCARFRRKSARSKDQAVRRFLSTNRIVMWAVTHTCQRLPHQVREEALDFIRDVREKVVGENRSLKYIINMDQTPVFFDMSTGKTLSEAGKKFRWFPCFFFF